MSIYGKFVKNISSPIICRRDGLKGLFTILKELEESQYWGKDRIITCQIQRLRKLLIHAFINTDYYQRLFNEAGFDPFQFKEPSELKKLPTLSKKQIRGNLTSLLSKNYQSNRIHEGETGGTTGVKMRFYRDNDCLSPKEAALYRFEKWAGWDFGERVGIVWPAQQDYIGHWTLKSKIKNELFLRQVVFPAAIIDNKSIDNYIKLLIEKKPVIIRAFTSPIYEVARYMRVNGIGNIALKGVITTGEPLYEHERQIISQAFHCEVFNSYRSREAGPLAQECERHNGLHINAESLYIETVNPGNLDCMEEGFGEIVVTDLLNYGMPLIRYKMGDFGIISDKSCSCGRGLPLLTKIQGRTADILYTPEKKGVTAGSLVLYLVDEAPGLLGQVQIIQDRFDHLIIKMTDNPLPSKEIIEYQKRTVRRLFGDRITVSFENVKEIPSEKSGKYRFTICNIPEDELI